MGMLITIMEALNRGCHIGSPGCTGTPVQGPHIVTVLGPFWKGSAKRSLRYGGPFGGIVT